MDALDQALELELCRRNPAYFIHHYCQLYDSAAKQWIPFHLWPFQEKALAELNSNQYNIWLKSRQIGCSWLGVADGLHGMIFKAIFHGLYFSLRSTEAEDLISPNKQRGMYQRLPDWMIAATNAHTTIDNVAYWQLANGSSSRAFASGTGDSYSASYAMLDEADLMPNLDDTLRRVNPTIEAGGRLLLLSRINKKAPKSPFRSIWKAARVGNNDYRALFFPWNVHPLRDDAWYERMARSATTQDELWEQYPATEQEALAMGYVGLVFPNFDIEQNVSPLADYDPEYPVEWWVDVGYTNPTAILFAQWRPFDGQPDRVCIFDMVYVSQQLPKTVILAALAKPYEAPSVLVYDSAAPIFAAEFRAIRQSHGLLTTIKGSRKNIDENIKNTRNYIGDAHNPRLLQIHPRCVTLIDELQTYHYKEHGTMIGGDYRPVSEDNHSVDGILYGLAQRIYKIGG